MFTYMYYEQRSARAPILHPFCTRHVTHLSVGCVALQDIVYWILPESGRRVRRSHAKRRCRRALVHLTCKRRRRGISRRIGNPSRWTPEMYEPNAPGRSSEKENDEFLGVQGFFCDAVDWHRKPSLLQEVFQVEFFSGEISWPSRMKLAHINIVTLSTSVILRYS